MRKLGFLIAVLAVFVLGDYCLSAARVVETSDLFMKTDYEKTILTHGGGVSFDRVFYGNSVVISAFIEDESVSGYVNFGIDYGTITDLRDMLEKGLLKPERELVLSLNYFVFLDTLDTNPNYPWHRGILEPYVFFQRDKLRGLFQAELERAFSGGERVRYTDLNKSVYYGMMTDAELDEKIKTHSELFWWQGVDSYEKNLAALEDVIALCEESGVRLRAVWMPWNSYAEMPETPAKVKALADEIMADGGVEILDMTDAMPRDCFHDLGHLNYEYGARVFTKEIDKWLIT